MDVTHLLDERELAARENRGYAVALTWNERTDRLTITVDDTRTGESFAFEAPSDRALDAFHHPFSYAPAWTLTTAERLAA